MAAFHGVEVICPNCRSELVERAGAFGCQRCGRVYPVVCGVPDFRLVPDPYIAIEPDRQKGKALWEAGRAHSYEEMLRHYYAITPEDPPDLAEHWTAHSLAEITIGRLLLHAAGLTGEAGEPADERTAARSPQRTLLDVGCSTGARLMAARTAYARLIGVDVAFRWLVLGRIRLREAGIEAALICANAEHLPLADASADTVTASDVLEHVRHGRLAVREVARVLAPGGRAVWTTNNRFALLPEPHVKLWGVGWLPRSWQPRYVARRRRDLLPYTIRLRSARELRRIFDDAGFSRVGIEAAPLVAPHISSAPVQAALRWHNRARTWPVAAGVLKAVGPRLWVLAER